MKLAARLLQPLVLAFCVAAVAQPGAPSGFQYQRTVTAHTPGKNCAVLPPAVFAHAAAALRDLRLFAGAPTPTEVPFFLTISEAQQADADTAAVLHARQSGNTLDFDLRMPARPYTEVSLDLAAQNFLATAEVTGLRSSTDTHPVPLGQFTLFDLAAQHLSRKTTLSLQESSFPLLHVRLRFKHLPGTAPSSDSLAISPDQVRGAAVPPSRARQVLFETAMTATPEQVGSATVARFSVPEHLPVERVLFRLAPGDTREFSRPITIVDHSAGSDLPETFAGTISSVNRSSEDLDLRQQQLTVDATVGANLQGPAELTVSVGNGTMPPLPITSVELQIRQTQLCFQSSAELLTLAYGDPELRSPQSSNAQTWTPTAQTPLAAIGPESRNPLWQEETPIPKQIRRHPHRIWIVLLGLAALVGIIAVQSSRRVHR